MANTDPESSRAADDLIARAARLDADDPLAHCRARFVLPEAMIYLDGNSLGAYPASVGVRLDDVLNRQWSQRLIRSWDEGWWETPERVGDRIAGLVGAARGQVVVGDSTSVNIFKLAIAGARMRPDRTRIVIDSASFPTDGYIVDSVARLLGLAVTRADQSDLDNVLGDDVALALLNHVDYRTGKLWDMASLTRSVHNCGAVALWDVCHSVGVVPLQFDALDVELAVGCTYKYLNGGPGAPAFLYVREDLHDALDQPLTGWHGHVDPFGMQSDYEPAAGIIRGRVGSPPLLSMLALDAALDAYDGVSLADARAKTQSVTGIFIDALDRSLAPGVIEIATPRDSSQRAGQVSIAHPRARELVHELIPLGVLADFREPDIIRCGFSPLYIGHTDAVNAVRALASLLNQ